jgi:hypothetical protein
MSVTSTRNQQHKAQASATRGHREHGPAGHLDPHADMLTLNRSAGNHAVDTLARAASALQAQSVVGRGGISLEPAVRSEMESRFGQDFGDVRVHHDASAARCAQAMSAKAYTVGRNVVFGEHRYAPGSHEGKRLLAHELAHVVQQSRGGAVPDPRGEASLEADASRAAQDVAVGDGAVAVSGASGVGIAREEDPSKKKGRLDRLFSAFLKSDLVPQRGKDAVERANDELRQRVDLADPTGALRETVKEAVATAIGDESLDAAHRALQGAAAPAATNPQPPSPEAAIRQQRIGGLQQQIAAIDSMLTGPGNMMLRPEYADELKIKRARLSHELATVQPATPEQTEAIVDADGIERRKQQRYDNFVNLPTSLQEDMRKAGIAAPAKPPIHWSGSLPSPDLQVPLEAAARKAEEDDISLGAALRKIQQEGPIPRSGAWSTNETEVRQELNRQMMAIGGKPAQDPGRASSPWEKTEIEASTHGVRNPRDWRAVYNPDTGDIVGYEREASGYYQRRNTKGEVTHAREAPMTEDATFLTLPDRELTPFERQHVFIEKDGRRNPESLSPIYNKSTGALVGYSRTSDGITSTYNTEGVMVSQFELGIEPSAIQADDLIGAAGIARAIGKKVFQKAGQWAARKAGKELVEQGGKRLVTGTGGRILEKVGKAEIKQAAREGAEQLGELTLKDVGEVGGKELAELGGTNAMETGVEQVGKAAAPFSPVPADVGDAAFKARMTRDVENAMRANMRNTIGAGGEAAAAASAQTTAMDLNAIQLNFPQVDTVSRQTVASVKAWGIDKPLSKRVMRRYARELKLLRTPIEPGVGTKLGQAVDLMATRREAIQAAGSWPNGLARNATPEQIAKFINQQGVLAIPADQVRRVRIFIAASAKANPAAYGLTEGPGLAKGIGRLTQRVQSLGLTSDELMAINNKVWANP